MVEGYRQTGELLAELAAIGAPRLSRQKNGVWHACLDFPAPDGVTAQVDSGFECKTPDEALFLLRKRLDGLRSMVSAPHQKLEQLNG
jgi:hypothetical protein